MAFRISEKKAREKGINRGSRTREQFANDKKFVPIFKEVKAEIRKMGFRIVEINDAIEQAVFEVYAALELGTTLAQGGYNDFSNH